MLKFHFELKDGDKKVEYDAGRTSNWQALDAVKDWPETPSKQIRFDFAWAFIAAKQAGKLAEVGIDEGTPIDEAADYIADTYDVVKITDNSRDTAPLAASPES